MHFFRIFSIDWLTSNNFKKSNIDFEQLMIALKQKKENNKQNSILLLMATLHLSTQLIYALSS